MIRFKPTNSPSAFLIYLYTLLSLLSIISCEKDASVIPSGIDSTKVISGGNAKDPQSSPTATEPTKGTNTGTNTGINNSSTKFTYKPADAIVLANQNNITISGDSVSGGSLNCIRLDNCANVHITKCKLQASTLYGILLNNCRNVLIDSCFITNVASGVHAFQCMSVKVNNNQFLNMNGPFPDGNFVQFNAVSGGACQINNNRCENLVGVVKNPQDGLSIFQSNGLPGDSIQVIGNFVRGGQVQHDSGGAAGIVLGDVGGSYQVARNNILVNPGAIGAQVQGGSHIKMDHNIIYSTSTPFTMCGLAYGNYSGTLSSNVNISYNKVKYYQTSGVEVDAWWDPATVSVPEGWNTNILNANINSNILPNTIITFK